jgi:hypothetical protein
MAYCSLAVPTERTSYLAFVLAQWHTPIKDKNALASGSSVASARTCFEACKLRYLPSLLDSEFSSLEVHARLSRVGSFSDLS